jgi:preprotein translocase subunit SecG
MNDIPEWSLGNKTSRNIDWQTIEDVVGIVSGLQRKAPADAGLDEHLSAEERDAARRAFVVVREEFAKAIGWIRTAMRWSIVGIVAAVAVAVIGGVLVQMSPWAGLISIVSIGSLFALLPKAFALARDQVMLELIPGRYALALELCSTRSDVQKLLTRFLDETSSMRKPAVTRTTRPKPK